MPQSYAQHTYERVATDDDEGTVACDETAGGTEVLPARESRRWAMILNTDASTSGYVGSGTVDSDSWLLQAGQSMPWYSQNECKVLSASGSINIKFIEFFD